MLPLRTARALSHIAPISRSSSIMAPLTATQAHQSRSFKAAASTSSTTASGPKVERMTVFGAGLMGAGIAQVGAQNGLKVCIGVRPIRSGK